MDAQVKKQKSMNVYLGTKKFLKNAGTKDEKILSLHIACQTSLKPSVQKYQTF